MKWPSRMSGRGREANPVVRDGLGSPPEGAGEVGSPTRMSGRSRNAHLEFREAKP